ncbi:MAG: STAS domain-containing protein [Thiobacillus sp.]|nr:STAS domain-containing protein [Thiobacillus sp.]
MALPFFKKGKDKTPSPAHKPTPAPSAESQPNEALLTMDMGGSGIVVVESSGAPQSAVDEAAILYASGQTDMAERLLKDILGTGGRRAWHMLFDLYGIQNREKEFEQLALDYAMRFETSPPVWQKMGGNGAASKPQNDQTASLELHGLLDKKAAATLREGIAATAKNAVVRIDFSRIAMVDESGADECAHILSAARKARRKLQVSGVDRLIALLQDLNRATHSRAVHWLLLLELYQTLGQEANFEDLAVDYAVRFEVSPPSWSEVQAAEVVQAKPAEPLDDALRLAGEITPANDSALQQLGSYATTHNEVLVDLTQVTRVDYGSVSQFISVLMQCLGSGKTITLRGHNALIHELFRVMGIDQLAHLIPHHPD